MIRKQRGDTIRIKYTFRDVETQQPAEPDTVTVTLWDSEGTVVGTADTAMSKGTKAGEYYADFRILTTSPAGAYNWKITALKGTAYDYKGGSAEVI